MLVFVDNASMRWKLGLAMGSTVVVSGLCSVMLFNGVAHGDWDLPGLNQQVQHVTEVTQNHEARITNLENQANTPGQPTPTPVVVTKVVTEPAPTSTPAVLAATVTPTPARTVVSNPLVCKADGYNWQVVTWSDGVVEEHRWGLCPSEPTSVFTSNSVQP